MTEYHLCLKDEQIEIFEGHNIYSYFWFRPVIVDVENKLEPVKDIDDQFSVEEIVVECFMYPFLNKYFDEELYCNKYGFGCRDEHGFAWNLISNFYTYKDLHIMIDEINHIIELLEHDYDNVVLDSLKTKFPILDYCYNEKYICPEQREQYSKIVIDFYRRFVKRLSAMMENNPDAHFISVMGP